MGGRCTGLRVCVGCEEWIIGRLEGKRLSQDTRPQGSSDLLLEMGGLNEGVMASYGQATNKIKKFLEI